MATTPIVFLLAHRPAHVRFLIGCHTGQVFSSIARHAMTTPSTTPHRHSTLTNAKRVKLSEAQKDSWASEVDRLRIDSQRQNRRLGTPLSQKEVCNPAISRIVDQIRILVRLIDSELLKYDMSSESVLPPESIRSLIELNNRWADRLENQIWLLEDNLQHGKQLNDLLCKLFGGGASAFPSFDRFAHEFADRIHQIPEAHLLLPEPGLILSEELAGHVEPGMSESIAKALQTTRLVAWAQSHSRKLAKGRRQAILFALLRDAGLFAIDSRFRKSRVLSDLNRKSRQLVAEAVSGWKGIPGGLPEMLAGNDGLKGQRPAARLVEAVARLVELMEAQSVELSKKNVLADTKTAFSPAVRQLLAESRQGQFDEDVVIGLVTTLGLNPRSKKQSAGFAERLLLFKRLRRHSSHREDNDTETSVPAPKFLRKRSTSLPLKTSETPPCQS